MAGNRRFILLIFGVKLDEVRAAMTHIPGVNTSIGQLEQSTVAAAATPEQPAPSPMGGGIRKADIIHPWINPRTPANPDASLIDFANYMQLPSRFVSLATHPKRTNLLCWNCSRAFTMIPRFIAHDSSRIECQGSPQYEWRIEGNFCTWACASAYIDEHFQDPKRWTLQQNLAVVRAQSDGVRIRPIRPAPSKVKMRSYCGSGGMSQQAYSDLVEALSVQQ